MFGDPRIPVLSMHDIGDLFVPFKMEQIYAQRVAAHGESRLFVSRAIRGVGHCDFTQAEFQRGFADLVTWVRTGHRPAGDRVTDARGGRLADVRLPVHRPDAGGAPGLRRAGLPVLMSLAGLSSRQAGLVRPCPGHAGA